MWNWAVVVKYINEEDDSINHIEEKYYSDVSAAYAAFNSKREAPQVEAVLLVVYPPEGLYHPSIMMAYNDSWSDEFIKFPDWYN